MASPKVSLIIPVYNIENYLRKSLDSAVNQTLKDIEIIVVNDGSTDTSPTIINEYAKRDRRIRVINKENQGAGFARNSGVTIAKGEYISFLDSDDWLDLDFLAVLYERAEKNNFDVVVSATNYWFENGLLVERYHIPNDILEAFFDFKFPAGAWGKIYRKNILNFGPNFFDDGIGEDILFTTRIIFRASNIGMCNRTKYNYNRINGNSVSCSFNEKYLSDYRNAYDSIKQELLVRGVFDDYKLGLVYRILITILFNIQDKMPKVNISQRVKKEIYRYLTLEEGLVEFFRKTDENLFLSWLAIFLSIEKEEGHASIFDRRDQLLVSFSMNIDKILLSYLKELNIEEIIIYGAGQIGEKLTDKLLQNKIRVSNIIDSRVLTDKYDKTKCSGSFRCGNINVRPPSYLSNIKEENYIFIASFTFHEQISTIIELIGLENRNIDNLRIIKIEELVEHGKCLNIIS